jgi:hypothetical protein
VRKTRLSELDPNWATTYAIADRRGEPDAISFDCPEADGGCGSRHVIPVTPDRGGEPALGMRWQRRGDDLAKMSITPSIRCGGCCTMHINIVGGEVQFCGDSKSGPDWKKGA